MVTRTPTMSYYGEETPDETDSQRSPDPYVATPTGFARKIGPRVKYGMNARTGDQVPDSQRQKASTGLGSSPSRLGSAMPQRESSFAAGQRQADEQRRANAAYLKSKEGKPTDKSDATKSGDSGMVNIANARSKSLRQRATAKSMTTPRKASEAPATHDGQMMT